MSHAPLGLDPALWQVLACPCAAHGELIADEAAKTLTCKVCGLAFPVRDGIPVMLMNEAVKPGQA
ncbi:MAG: Trm112 family protein [Actinomycetes bacterium]